MEVQQQQRQTKLSPGTSMIHIAPDPQASPVASPPAPSRRKRSFVSPMESSSADGTESRRKAHRVSRACDMCKSKKARCSGTKPCENCVRKGIACQYDASYSRGRPPTPPPSQALMQRNGADTSTPAPDASGVANSGQETPMVSRNSPELEMAEIEGQYSDSTSGLTFLHRAWKRLSNHDRKAVPDVANSVERPQLVFSAGDKPLQIGDNTALPIPDRQTALGLSAFYFEVCIASYRFLHQQTADSWLDAVLSNAQHSMPLWHSIGHPKAAIVLTVLAIATFYKEKSKTKLSFHDDAWSLRQSDQLFSVSMRLTEEETGLPRLESAQARLIQVLYLLHTSRMNQGWYVFGNTLQIISALGLHRRRTRKRNTPARTSDYITYQCRRRTFWTAYTLDNHLGVIFGRPRHFHDEDIDQELPDRVNDEDMTPQGPTPTEFLNDCHIDALVFHARITRIVGNISRDVYSIRPTPKHERLTAARRLVQELHEWKSSLPPHLGTIRPSSLIPSFRRQSMGLKLAYSHAVMHANRPALLGNFKSQSDPDLSKESIDECIAAARVVLETVESQATDGTLFHASWWAHYITFCALAVVYVWEIQKSITGCPVATDESHVKLLDLAERCQAHLGQATATNSPSRRYSIILEELRQEAKSQSTQTQASCPTQSVDGMVASTDDVGTGLLPTGGSFAQTANANFDPMFQGQGEPVFSGMQNLLDDWQTTDWLDLDSSAFGPFADFGGSPVSWLSNNY